MNEASGFKLFLSLSRIHDKLREENSKSMFTSFSPFFKALSDLLHIFRKNYPECSNSLRVESTNKDVHLNPFDLAVPFGKDPNVDLSRVRLCLESIFTSSKLPSTRLIDLAYDNLSCLHAFRLCLKELETSIKMNKQTTKWKEERKAWVSMVNGMHSVSMITPILLLLQKSLQDSAFIHDWATKESAWIAEVQNRKTLPEYALCLLKLEEFLRFNGDSEDSRPTTLVTSWRSSCLNWRKTLSLISSGKSAAAITGLPTAEDAVNYEWNILLDFQLVQFVDQVIAKVSFDAEKLILTFCSMEED
jgi:hypothetical protein